MRCKWFVATGALIVAALIASVFWYLNTYDYNKLKPRVARMFKDATGRELNLGGEINLALGLSPALVVRDVMVANAPWGSQPQMIKAEKLEAEVRLLPLLFKEVQLKRIGLSGVEVLLETAPDGQGNWDFIAGYPAAGKTGMSKPNNIEIDNIRIEKFQLILRESKTGFANRISIASLGLAKSDTEDEFTLDLTADYNGQPLTLSGKTGLIHFLLVQQRFPFELSGTFANAKVEIAGAIDDIPNLQGIDLTADVSGMGLAALGLDNSIRLPKTCTLDVSGHLRGSRESLALNDVSGHLSASDMILSFSGNIGDLIARDGIDLKLNGSGRDLSEIGPIIGQKLPSTDKFAVKGQLRGSGKILSLAEAQGSASRGSLNLTLLGDIKDLPALSGLDLQFTVSGKELAEMGPIIGAKLPATDNFSVHGRLTGSAKILSLREAIGHAHRGDLRLAMEGGIRDLSRFNGIDLVVKSSGKDLSEAGRIFDEKLPVTDEFSVEGRLMGSAKSLSLKETHGSAKRGDLALAVNGGIEELLAFKGINLKLKASGRELAGIGPLIGAKMPELGPFDASGKISGYRNAFSIENFSMILDKSDFKGLAKVEFLKRPKITARLESSSIDFTTLMKSLEKGKQKSTDKYERKRRLFSDDPLPFDALEKVDADIVLQARNIHAKDARLEFGHLVLKLEEHDFSIDKLEATYKETKISGNLQINAGTPSQLSGHFLVQNFNLGDFLRETGKSDQVRANVDIAAYGKSSGDSVSSLMANLDGSIGAVMGEGYLTKYLDLLSINLTQKVISFWGRHEKADQIQCAVVQFDINKGIADSRAFVFDTQAGILTGEGKINLGTEQINFLLVPQAEHPNLSFSTKLRVSGTVTEPKVRPDTVSLLTEGAKLLSTLAVGPIGLLAPFVHLGANKKHPCEVGSTGQLGLDIPASK